MELFFLLLQTRRKVHALTQAQHPVKLIELCSLEAIIIAYFTRLNRVQIMPFLTSFSFTV